MVHFKNTVLFNLLFLLSVNCNVFEKDELIFVLNEDIFYEKKNEGYLSDKTNGFNFNPIRGTLIIGGEKIKGILGGYTCNDAKCISEEHIMPPILVQINKPQGCVDTRCIEMPEHVNLPVINIPPDYNCKYAICTEVYYESLLLAPYRGWQIMKKPQSCTDAKCVQPLTKHAPDSDETTSEERIRKQQEEDAKNKEKTEAAKKEAEEKKKAKEKAEKEKKEAEKKEQEAKDKKEEAERTKKKAEHRSSRAKEKYEKEYKDDPNSNATIAYKREYNESVLAVNQAVQNEIQANIGFESKINDRIAADRRFAQSEREFNQANERYEWNVRADRAIRRWRNTQAVCNSVGCDFIPIGLKQP